MSLISYSRLGLSLACLLPTLSACGGDSGGGSDPQTLPTYDAGSEDAQVVPEASTGVMDASFADADLDTDASADAGDGGRSDGGNDGGGDGGSARAENAVGTVRIELKISDNRTIPVQIWYPAVDSARAEATTGHPTQEFEPTGAQRDKLAAMLAKGTDKCTSKTMHAAHAPAALAQTQKFPALLFSHCLDCFRFSSFTVAEHLAANGFVVAAPDHVGGTLYDGVGALGLTEDNLVQRTKDVAKVIDTLLDAQSTLLPASLKGKIDADRIGMYGHSFGAITTARMLLNEPRIKAGALLTAPFDPPFQDWNVLADVTRPALFVKASEDTNIINTPLQDNFDLYPKPVWLVEIKDAGHYSVTDIVGIDGQYPQGCGKDLRVDNPNVEFTFIDIDLARTITKSYVAAFFNAQLNNDAAATSYLSTATPKDNVAVKKRP